MRFSKQNTALLFLQKQLPVIWTNILPTVILPAFQIHIHKNYLLQHAIKFKEEKNPSH